MAWNNLGMMSVEQAHVSDDNAIISAYRQKNISFDEAKIQIHILVDNGTKKNDMSYLLTN